MKVTARYRISARISLQLVLVFMLVAGAFGQMDKEKLQKTKKQLEDEIRYTTELLEKTKASKQVSMEKLKILNQRIRSREALIATINKELGQIDMNIQVENVELDKMSKQLKALKTDYARMIYHAYRTMNGRNKLMFIFSAKDFNQAWQRIKYYQQYSEYRRRQAERIESTTHVINDQRKDLETKKQEKLTLFETQQKEKIKLDLEKQDKAKTVKELSSKEKQLVSTLKTKQQAAARLQYEIEKLIASEIRASEERMQKTTGNEKKPTGHIVSGPATYEMTPREKELSSSFASNRGRLPWPCEKGFISGTFGEHPHPVLERVKVKNNGVDITTEPNAAVKAVFNGRVSKVMSFPNLNNVVIVRHGEYLTVYSNLDVVSVKEGQEVSTRQAIGKVHYNTEEQKTELHFEIWKGKMIQNPESWLAGR
ncbi:MAG: peptidoglycan DD-metalloendopeptidase family protein [Bacteroidetes bacterium]|nr:peptidoglycan DD-metalloendopeptidase family protein [Bacteroidota bacterium]